MNNTIFFSVIIPLYNKEKEISRAISSVLEQSHTHFELLVIDDGSTDKSIEITESFGDKVKIIKQKNQGASAARNTGISHSAHNYIAFLDADDEWDPEFLNSIKKCINEYPEAGIYATNYTKQTSSSEHTAVKTKKTKAGKIHYFETFRKGGATPISSSSVCIQRNILKESGGFPVDIHLYEDLYFWIKISLNNQIIFDPCSHATYHREADNRACNNIIPTEEDLPFKELIQEILNNKQTSNEAKRDAQFFLTHYSLLNAFKAVTKGQNKTAQLCLKTAKPVTSNQIIRLLFIQLLLRLPEKTVSTIHSLGKKLKS